MSAVDPGAVPLARMARGLMRCECGGVGKITDVMEMDDKWSLVTWVTAHFPWCPGLAWPERTFLLDTWAAWVGYLDLPWLPAEAERRSPLPVPAWPPAQCAAYAWTTGRRCRREAGPDGLCGTHRRQA